jgi:serine/threonine-protein kinase
MPVDANSIKEHFPEIKDVSHIKDGGQKSVFHGVHGEYGDVVVKVLLSQESTQRVLREIEIVTGNQFPNVPKIFSSRQLSICGDETLCIIEQYICGRNLRDILRAGTLLSVDAVISLLRQMLLTIAELENAHLVHRDIKPENLIVDNNDNFWLLDFGIARHLDLTSITATEEHFGPHTIGYAAPEQYRNIKPQIDSRADLFSLGVVAYEAVSGENPFTAGATSALDVIRRIESTVPAHLCIEGELGAEVAAFIGVLMAKYPSRRPQSARVALEWFESIANRAG